MNDSLGSRTLQRVMWMSAVGTVLTGIIGFIVVMVLNAFVLDEFDAYGEIPIPGSGELVLPEGEVEISFHASVVGGPSGSFPMPPLTLSIEPPPTVADPVVTRDVSGTTTVNSDMHLRLWVAQLEAGGPYKISTKGDVQGYINPRLAFGHESDYDWLHWFFVGMVGLGLLEVGGAVLVSKQAKRAAPPISNAVTSFQPDDHGIKVEQIKIVAALRDSGALTQDEFEVEKRRILES